MEHTVTAYEEELRGLSREVERLGHMAVDQLRAALDVIAGRPGRPAQEIMAQDKTLNASAGEIELRAVRMIALRQPMADDLRRTIAAIKNAIDLERCGDLAKNIAKRSLRIDGPIPPTALDRLDRLGAASIGALEEVVDAYVASDVERARAVWRRDHEIDDLHSALTRELISRIEADPRLVAAGAQLLLIAKNLERVGDHASNLAEAICYEHTGSRDISPVAEGHG
jgi:phosphate transport system protein